MSIPSNYLSATEAQVLIQKGELTVTQLALDHIARLDEREDAVRAWVKFERERVLLEAARLDAVPFDERGPLHGVFLGVKDMINTKDMTTEHFSPLYQDSKPGIDAAPVALCRAAGALVYGKTHTTEFASTAAGTPCRNPHSTLRTPGGSSSGSGAAVADWQCHVSFGTQTGGSTIRPGSYNGIFAFKPTWGSISREGLKQCSNSNDTLGLYARSIADLQLLSSVFRLVDDVPPPSPPKPISACRFAFIKTVEWDERGGPGKALVHAWDRAKDLLIAAGATVVDVELPPAFDKMGEDHIMIMYSEAAASFLPEYTIDKSALYPSIQSFVDSRPTRSRAALLAAEDRVAALRPIIDALAAEYDAIITPSVPDIAPLGLEWTGDARFCRMWTILHTPVVNVPGFAGEDGMPIGLSLVAPRYRDENLLAVAATVAKVWDGADGDKLSKLPAPDGARAVVV